MRQLMLVRDIILPMRTEANEAREFLRRLEREGLVIGTDEAGRGALAGPVVAAAVMLTPKQEKALSDLGLKDSKKLSEKKREKIFSAMKELGVMWRAFMETPETIDRENILRASLLAMRESVARLEKKLDKKISCVIVDGNYEVPELNLRQWALIRADDMIPCVSAASVTAKVIRDRLMTRMNDRFPEYEFSRNKGYPTQRHIEIVKALGISTIHRRTFCRKFLKQGR